MEKTNFQEVNYLKFTGVDDVNYIQLTGIGPLSCFNLEYSLNGGKLYDIGLL